MREQSIPFARIHTKTYYIILKGRPFVKSFFKKKQKKSPCLSLSLRREGQRGKKQDEMGKINTRDWLIVEGILTEEYSKLYGGKGPVLNVRSVEYADKPIQEVATFY